jgi:hypothetical protein
MTNIEVRLDDIEVGLDSLDAKLTEGRLIRSAAQKGGDGAEARPNSGAEARPNTEENQP